VTDTRTRSDKNKSSGAARTALPKEEADTPRTSDTRNIANDQRETRNIDSDFFTLRSAVRARSERVHPRRHSQWIWRRINWYSELADFGQHRCRIGFDHPIGKSQFDGNRPEAVRRRSWAYPSTSKRTRDWSATIVNPLPPRGEFLSLVSFDYSLAVLHQRQLAVSCFNY
jgi:hypothetical protein